MEGLMESLTRKWIQFHTPSPARLWGPWSLLEHSTGHPLLQQFMNTKGSVCFRKIYLLSCALRWPFASKITPGNLSTHSGALNIGGPAKFHYR